MEVNLRLVLAVISVVAICGIYINGRLKIRKNKNPYKLKAETSTDEIDQPTQERSFDHDGFDQDGIGKVKAVVVAPDPEPETMFSSESTDHQVLAETEQPTKQDIEQFHQSFESVADESHYQLEPELTSHSEMPKAVVPAPSQSATKVSATNNSAPKVSAQKDRATENKYYDDMPTMSAVDVKEAPVAKKVVAQEPIKAEPKVRTKSKAELKRDQLEIDFDAQNEAKKVELEQEVLALSVVVNELAPISGAPLLQNLLTLGLKFGEMNIFHRHQDNAGKGPITFSLANMVNPGTFDLDNIENFTTQGITLFMTLPNAGDPTKVYKLMLSAAKQLAKEFNGQVLDSKRSVMTPQTEQHYLSKIREFDRKSRLAGY